MEYLNAAVQLVPLLIDPNAHRLLGFEQRRQSIERALADAFVVVDNAIKARDALVKAKGG